jgi:Raf kinase inhibitor-like YbhB/YbcL family protein
MSVSLRHRLPLCLALAAAALASGCGGGGEATTGEAATEAGGDGTTGASAGGFTLSSSAFAEGGQIPVEFTCDGAGSSPPIEWSGVPKGTEGLALLLQDPDAPSGTFLHASIYDIPADVNGIGAGATPPGTVGTNDFGDQGYGPPCPPEGDGPHRYVFTLYALPAATGLAAGASPSEVVEAVDAAAIASTELTGTYER